MTRPTAFATPIVALALCSLVWLSSLAPALAATVTDTFQLKATGTERCRNNPKFFDTTHVKAKDGVTLTVTRDAHKALKRVPGVFLSFIIFTFNNFTLTFIFFILVRLSYLP